MNQISLSRAPCSAHTMYVNYLICITVLRYDTYGLLTAATTMTENADQKGKQAFPEIPEQACLTTESAELSALGHPKQKDKHFQGHGFVSP